MLTLYHGTGARECTIIDDTKDDARLGVLRPDAIRLLRARRQQRAVEILESTPFELSGGTNDFQDEFSVLHLTLPIEAYATFAEDITEDDSIAYRTIAQTFAELGTYVRFIVVRPKVGTEPGLVPNPDPVVTTAIVEKALYDAQRLLESSGPASAVDRAHTALHGYLLEVCSRAAIEPSRESGVTGALKALRQEHPAFQVTGPGGDEARRVVQALATIVDATNTLRNRASLAHANLRLLDEAEAILMVNCVRTLLHYLDAKLR